MNLTCSRRCADSFSISYPMIARKAFPHGHCVTSCIVVYDRIVDIPIILGENPIGFISKDHNANISKVRVSLHKEIFTRSLLYPPKKSQNMKFVGCSFSSYKNYKDVVGSPRIVPGSIGYSNAIIKFGSCKFKAIFVLILIIEHDWKLAQRIVLNELISSYYRCTNLYASLTSVVPD